MLESWKTEASNFSNVISKPTALNAFFLSLNSFQE